MRAHKLALIAAHAKDCDKDTNELARETHKRISSFRKAGLPIQVVTVSAVAANGGNAAIIKPFDYYDSVRIITDDCSIVGINSNIKI